MSWLRANWKQVIVMAASAGCAVAIQLHPEYRTPVLAIGAVLGVFGIHLMPVAYGKKEDGGSP